MAKFGIDVKNKVYIYENNGLCLESICVNGKAVKSILDYENGFFHIEYIDKNGIVDEDSVDFIETLGELQMSSLRKKYFGGVRKEDIELVRY